MQSSNYSHKKKDVIASYIYILRFTFKRTITGNHSAFNSQTDICAKLNTLQTKRPILMHKNSNLAPRLQGTTQKHY